MSDYETIREKALKAVLEQDDYGRGLGALNHLLEDQLSTNRVRQVIAFLSDVTLQVNGRGFRDAMTEDAVEGLGWILRSCHEALAILEDIRNATRREQTVALRTLAK